MEGVDNKRERSALYPMCTVDDCFEIIELIDKLGGKVYSNSSIAQALGMSEKTNSFRARISTLRQYGLISGNQGTVKLTSIANDYLYPTQDEQKRDAKLQAFLGVPLYKKLVEKYENQALPSMDKLANILLGKEFGLTKATKDSAVENFMKSLEQLELITNGVLVINPPKKEIDIMPVKDEADQNSTMSEFSQLGKETVDKYYNFEIPTLCGKAAVIKIPQDVTGKDLDFIQLYIENMLPVFLQNLRSEE